MGFPALPALGILLALLYLAAACSPEPSPPLPVDSSLMTGTLANGLDWYFLPREGGQLHLQLRVAAGSLAEQDSQRGYAHFVEHMAFNGTRHFAPGELVPWLQGHGASISAWTTCDDTIFSIQVPSSDTNLVQKAFLFLQDVAAGYSFDPQEVDKERNVLLEEMRNLPETNLVAAFRWGADYGVRMPGCASPGIRNAAGIDLLGYWQEWYRPDLMSLTLAGTYNSDALIDLIEASLGPEAVPLPLKPQSPMRSVGILPPEQTRVLVEVMQRNSWPWLELFRPLPDLRGSTEAVVLATAEACLMGSLHAHRMARLLDEGILPLLQVGTGLQDNNLQGISPDEVLTVQFAAEDGSTSSANDPLVRFGRYFEELERMRRYGFDETEWAAALRDTEKTLKELYPDEYPDIGLICYNLNRYHAGMTDAAPPLYKRNLALAYLDSMTLQSVNRRAQDWFLQDGLRIVCHMSEKYSDTTEQQVFQVLKAAKSCDIQALEPRKLLAEPLIPPAAAGQIVDEIMHPNSGIREWSLSNGARVLWLKRTDMGNDYFCFGAWGPGGLYALPDELAITGRMVQEAIPQTPMGGMDSSALSRYAAEKEVQLSFYLDELGHGMNGKGSPYELEAFMRLVHGYCTLREFPEQSFTVPKSRALAAVRESPSNAGFLADRVFRDFKARGNKRLMPLTTLLADEAQAGLAGQVWQSSFGDAAGATFMFTGDLDEDELKGLCETWLASLPSSVSLQGQPIAKPQPVRPVQVPLLPHLKDTLQVSGSFVGASFVYLGLEGIARRGNQDDLMTAELARRALEDRLFKTIREELGGTYVPQVSYYSKWDPEPVWGLRAWFSCNPPRRMELLGAVRLVLADFARNGMGDGEFRDMLEDYNQANRTAMSSLEGQAEVLSWMVESGLPLDAHYDSVRQLSLSPEGFRQWCQDNLAPENWVCVMVNPADAVR